MLGRLALALGVARAHRSWRTGGRFLGVSCARRGGQAGGLGASLGVFWCPLGGLEVEGVQGVYVREEREEPGPVRIDHSEVGRKLYPPSSPSLSLNFLFLLYTCALDSSHLALPLLPGLPCFLSSLSLPPSSHFPLLSLLGSPPSSRTVSRRRITFCPGSVPRSPLTC